MWARPGLGWPGRAHIRSRTPVVWGAWLYHRYQRLLRPPLPVDRATKPMSQTASRITATHHKALRAKPAPNRSRAKRRTTSSGTIVINLLAAACPDLAPPRVQMRCFWRRFEGTLTISCSATGGPPQGAVIGRMSPGRGRAHANTLCDLRVPGGGLVNGLRAVVVCLVLACAAVLAPGAGTARSGAGTHPSRAPTSWDGSARVQFVSLPAARS